ncbi:MAG: sigma-70 family RNA polymerase sigma factor [Azospirillaceae bacterium]
MLNLRRHDRAGGVSAASSASVPDRDSLSDNDLIASIARADRTALKILYDRYAGKLLGVARMFTRNHALAEEAVQETLMAVWRGAAGFDETRTAQAWLFSIARYKAIDLVRRESARAPSEESIQTLQMSEYAQEDLLENTSATRMVLGRLMDSVDTLSRGLVQDAFFNGYSHSELSERYDLPIGTVKSRIRRALQAMRTQVNRDDL